jgi:hypothetical protein
MPNLSGLSAATTSATALSNLILVSPQDVVGYQPQNPPFSDGTPSTAPLRPALLFHYEGEQTAMLESDITDHYVEDNTAIQDQIALRPETITTHGFIGELNDVPTGILKLLKAAADKLLIIGAYTPELAVAAQIAYAEATLVYAAASSLADSAISAWDTLQNQGGNSVIGSGGLTPQKGQNKQQTMFQQFYGYWRDRRLFTVQTPWAVFQDMAIKSLRAIQDAETRVITDFEVTFKIIRNASTITSSTLPPGYQTIGNAQASPLQDLGTSALNASGGIGESISSMVAIE